VLPPPHSLCPEAPLRLIFAKPSSLAPVRVLRFIVARKSSYSPVQKAGIFLWTEHLFISPPAHPRDEARLLSQWGTLPHTGVRLALFPLTPPALGSPLVGDYYLPSKK